MAISQVLHKAILGQIGLPIPHGLNIVPGSVPIVFFGKIDEGISATIGINPSLKEFLDAQSQILPTSLKRVVDRHWLTIPDSGAIPAPHHQAVFDSFKAYFDNKNFYKPWFGRLETFFRPMNLSYHDGSLIHLDLTPWATDPVWGQLSQVNATAPQTLLALGRPLLITILNELQLKFLFANGKAVVDQLSAFGIQFTSQEVQLAGKNCTIVLGRYQNTSIIGWSTNLQSSWGVSSDFLGALAEKVKRYL